MDYDSYFGLSTSSRNYQSTLKSQLADICFDFDELEIEEEDEDEELKGDYFCPLCSEDFDLVGLCCHVEEEHPVEAKSGICPICAVKVGYDLFGHIAAQHGNISNNRQRLKPHKGEPHSTFSSLRKELQNGHFQSFLSRSSSSSSKMSSDPLLSFIYNMTPDGSESVQPDLKMREKAEEKGSFENLLEPSHVQESTFADEDGPEKAKRSQFVQGLMLSTIFGDEDL